MELGLDGKAVLITGASRGIGAAVARAFAREGVASLHLSARTEDDLRALKAELEGESLAQVTIHGVDLSLAEARASLAEAAAEVDILVNNAGAIPPGPLEEADLDQWRSAWDLKVWGYIDFTKRFMETMTGRDGVIINNIGISGERPDSAYVAGTTANAALMAFTRAVGASSMDRGVRVVAVNPGPVETDRLVGALQRRAEQQEGDASLWRTFTEHYSQGRMARPDEVADLIVFLASERSSYTSGSVMTVDGGFASKGRAF